MNQEVTSQIEQRHVYAKVLGEEIFQLPQDLYIPPEALKIFLEAFEGPLDLLLYLIKKQNINILDIPIAQITHQYIQYVDLMRELQIELAAEYLVMASMLAEIKSRLLLPRPTLTEEGEEIDPRAELIRRLQEYERFKKAAEDIDLLPRIERDIFVSDASSPPMPPQPSQQQVDLSEILQAYKEVMKRAELYSDHQIERELLSVRERMTIILSTVKSDVYTSFVDLFNVKEGKMGVVVTLIAILELIRQSMIELVQAQAFAPIYIKSKGGAV